MVKYSFIDPEIIKGYFNYENFFKINELKYSPPCRFLSKNSSSAKITIKKKIFIKLEYLDLLKRSFQKKITTVINSNLIVFHKIYQRLDKEKLGIIPITDNPDFSNYCQFNPDFLNPEVTIKSQTFKYYLEYLNYQLIDGMKTGDNNTFYFYYPLTVLILYLQNKDIIPYIKKIDYRLLDVFHDENGNHHYYLFSQYVENEYLIKSNIQFYEFLTTDIMNKLILNFQLPSNTNKKQMRDFLIKHGYYKMVYGDHTKQLHNLGNIGAKGYIRSDMLNYVKERFNNSDGKIKICISSF